MLIILLFFALIRTLRGVPLALSVEGSDIYPALDPRDSQNHFGQRRVNDIVISCAATIFACTWSAVHPNIPAMTDSGWTRLKRQVTTTIYAVLAPELIIVWALRQRLGAVSIRDNYNKVFKDGKTDPKGWFKDIVTTIRTFFQGSDPGTQWTLTHGFFLQMGGFMLSDENGKPTLILRGGDPKDPEKTTSMIWNIQNRVIDRPRITERDIKDRSKGNAISKAFIVLQTTWFIVQCVTRWATHLPVTELEIVTLGFAMLNGITYVLWWDKPKNAEQPVLLKRNKVVDYSSNPQNDASSSSSSSPDILLTSLQFLVKVPLLKALFTPLERMYADSDESLEDMKVGSYYAVFHTRGNTTIEYVGVAIGISFGAVHLIPAWFLEFPSRLEMWLWRASAIFIIAEPMCIGIWVYTPRESTWELLSSIIMVIGIPLYFISRIVLFTISLISLRSLPAGALQTIVWTTFIPHL